MNCLFPWHSVRSITCCLFSWHSVRSIKCMLPYSIKSVKIKLMITNYFVILVMYFTWSWELLTEYYSYIRTGGVREDKGRSECKRGKKSLRRGWKDNWDRIMLINSLHLWACVCLLTATAPGSGWRMTTTSAYPDIMMTESGDTKGQSQ